jgi:hypothetical protein
MICGKCGGNQAYRIAPDYVDYCPDCGIIEGLGDDVSPTGMSFSNDIHYLADLSTPEGRELYRKDQEEPGSWMPQE